MPMTSSGRRVTPAGVEYPSMTDVAVGLFRQPRFAGQGRRWFSVGDHSLFVDDMVIATAGLGRLDRLALLLHDAHESMTGDVPTDWKDDQLRMRQIGLDHRIMNAFFPGGIAEFGLYHDTVKHFDRRAVIAEATVVGPRMTQEFILGAFGTTDHTRWDIELLQDRLYYNRAWFGVPPTVESPESHPGAVEYLRRVTNLL